MNVCGNCGFLVKNVCKPLLHPLFHIFWWLFSLVLRFVSAFPTYCLLHELHSIKYITKLLAEFTLWNILYISFVCWLLKVVVFCTFLQQSDLTFVRNREHLPGFNFCNYLLLTLFFLTLLLPINSLSILFHLNDAIDCRLILLEIHLLLISSTVFRPLYWCVVYPK